MTEATMPDPATENRIHEFSFSGNAREYFGIWIVNLLLSIITLGIYTAWAKVRRLRYFYGNTWLDGHNFEYHAKPVQILIGRIIAISLLIAYNVVAEFVPVLALVLLIPYLLGLPWLINKALQFNSRMTSYRNIRLGFVGSYGRALWVFIVLPLIVPFVAVTIGTAALFVFGSFQQAMGGAGMIVLPILGLLFLIGFLLFLPYISKQANSYLANGLRFGSSRFSAEIPLSALYRNLGFSMLPLLVIVALFVPVPIVMMMGLDAASDIAGVMAGIASFFVYLVLLVAYLAYSAGVRNIAFNATTIDGQHQLLSAVPRYGYAWVLVSNLFVSVITIGLMIPWAAVRTWKYLARHTAVRSATGLDRFTADQEAQGNVAAAEYLDIDGIDFGL